MMPDVGRNKSALAGVSGEVSRLVRVMPLPEIPVNGLIPAYGVRNISYKAAACLDLAIPKLDSHNHL